jgi:hypothetical protein
VFGFGLQAFICGFNRQNICSVLYLLNPKKVRRILLINEIRVTFAVNKILKIEIFWGHVVSKLKLYLIIEAVNFWGF